VLRIQPGAPFASGDLVIELGCRSLSLSCLHDQGNQQFVFVACRRGLRCAASAAQPGVPVSRLACAFTMATSPDALGEARLRPLRAQTIRHHKPAAGASRRLSRRASPARFAKSSGACTWPIDHAPLAATAGNFSRGKKPSRQARSDSSGRHIDEAVIGRWRARGCRCPRAGEQRAERGIDCFELACACARFRQAEAVCEIAVVVRPVGVR